MVNKRKQLIMPRKFYIQNIVIAPSIVFENEAPEGYTEVTNYEERKRLHSKRYKENESDGVEYVFEYTAELYLDIIDGNITPLDVFLFEQHVRDVLNQIKGGHWLTAQASNISLSLSGIYDQARKDSIQIDIDNHIKDNY